MNSATTAQTSKRPPVMAGTAPYKGAFGKKELLHLLKRTLFGVKKSDLDSFAGKTLEQVVDALLVEPTTIPSPPVNNYNNANTTDPSVPLGSTWVYAPLDGGIDGARRSSLRSWWGGLMLNQDRTVFEKMVLFWHNHFATESIETNSLLFYDHLMFLRKNVFVDFRKFVRDVTLDANMLRYLNGYLNSKNAPDENYGRELQELFTLGKGPDSQYTEGDVKESAKVLTGWRFRRIVSPTDATKNIHEVWFDASRHDTGVKKFSSFYGGKTITGSTANTRAEAERELDEMLKMIFEQPEVAKFICRKLYGFFVYYEIDATTEAQVITPLADLLRQSNYNIKPVLKTLLMSEHFFDLANRGCLIKSPVDYCVGMMREFEVAVPEASDYVSLYNAWSTMIGNASVQGQNVGNPPSVAGWPAYYQEPVFHEYWINTDSFPRRVTFGSRLLSNNGYSVGTNKRITIDVIKFADQFGKDTSDPNKLIDLSLELLYIVPASAKLKARLKRILLSEQADDSYWIEAWDNYKGAPTNTTFRNTVVTRLQNFYKLIVELPEYNLS